MNKCYYYVVIVTQQIEHTFHLRLFITTLRGEKYMRFAGKKIED